MAKNNPYSLMFGKAPMQVIPRSVLTEEVCSMFMSEQPSQQIYMITGVRGSGKTVFMTEIQKRFSKEKDWVTVELNPAKDLLLSLAAKLYNDQKLTSLFKTAKINLSFYGIGVEISGADPITDIEVAITRMLETLKKKKKRLLITIDEVTSTEDMRVFASAYQIFVRKDLPVFLLMTGLYENINALQNDKMLTFLYRAPKINLGSLNMGSIANNYLKTFKIDEDTAITMAKITKGYPFAFQVLGYYTFENGGSYEKALDGLREYLDEYVYEKIWSELSSVDKKVVNAIASSKTGKIADIRKNLSMESNEFSPYRDRLIKKGLINGDERGRVSFTLPLFEKFVIANYY